MPPLDRYNKKPVQGPQLTSGGAPNAAGQPLNGPLPQAPQRGAQGPQDAGNERTATGFVNINRIFNANQGAAKQMADKRLNPLEQKSNAYKGNIDGLSQVNSTGFADNVRQNDRDVANVRVAQGEDRASTAGGRTLDDALFGNAGGARIDSLRSEFGNLSKMLGDKNAKIAEDQEAAKMAALDKSNQPTPEQFDAALWEKKVNDAYNQYMGAVRGGQPQSVIDSRRRYYESVQAQRSAEQEKYKQSEPTDDELARQQKQKEIDESNTTPGLR